MRRILHFDRIEFRFDRKTLRDNGDGTRTVDGVGARVGNMTYHDDKGRPFIEHVPESTLFDPASLASAAGSTLTIRHGPGLVGPAQYRAEAHGSWVKAWDAGDGNLGSRLRLGSQEALDFVDRAIAKDEPVELSPVYEVDVDDAPGTTEHGRHDAVQRGRIYSGIAMLGPAEARGGPGMRLQLDGPVCAPAGARVQVTVRLDSAPRVPLHSTPTRRNTMKHATISNGGRRRTVTSDTIALIRALALDVRQKGDGANADQIAVGRVLVEIEGEEPVDLMLPVAMIEMLLEGIGAGPSTAPVEPPTEPDPAAADPAAEATDADDDEKMDAKAVKKIVAAAIKASNITRDAATSAMEARRASVNADAMRVLPPGYEYGVHWTQVALDAIAKAQPDGEARAKTLAVKARNGDAVAEGRLREMLSQCVATTLATTPPSAPAKKTDADEPWASPEMPAVEKSS